MAASMRNCIEAATLEGRERTEAGRRAIVHANGRKQARRCRQEARRREASFR